MKKSLLLLLLASATQWGCQFLGGAAVGGSQPEPDIRSMPSVKMDRLEEDYKHERISRQEYESRKAQIERGSIIY